MLHLKLKKNNTCAYKLNTKYLLRDYDFKYRRAHGHVNVSQTRITQKKLLQRFKVMTSFHIAIGRYLQITYK